VRPERSATHSFLAPSDRSSAPGLAAQASVALARVAVSASRPEPESLERMASATTSCAARCLDRRSVRLGLRLLGFIARRERRCGRDDHHGLSDVARVLAHAERPPDGAECLQGGAQREAGDAELKVRP